MEKFIPYEKLSKNEKRKLDRAKRKTWGELNPVTRKPKNSKAYDRKNAQDWKKEHSSSAHFAFYGRCKSKLITLRISKAIFLRCYFCRDPLLFRFGWNFNWQREHADSIQCGCLFH